MVGKEMAEVDNAKMELKWLWYKWQNLVCAYTLEGAGSQVRHS